MTAEISTTCSATEWGCATQDDRSQRASMNVTILVIAATVFVAVTLALAAVGVVRAEVRANESPAPHAADLTSVALTH